jgi:hypothetical protein
MTIREHVSMALMYVRQNKKSAKEFLRLLKVHHDINKCLHLMGI